MDTPTRAAYQRALGQVLLALRGHEVVAGGWGKLDYWRTADGHRDIDWKHGPFPDEVVAALLEAAADPECDELQPGDIGSAGPDRPETVWVNGVHVRFVPWSPIGADEHFGRRIEEIRRSGEGQRARRRTCCPPGPARRPASSVNWSTVW